MRILCNLCILRSCHKAEHIMCLGAKLDIQSGFFWLKKGQGRMKIYAKKPKKLLLILAQNL